ncbi:MAG: hypothetical protein IRZ16_01270 [Myxococcaceae bacterium]|nr:hypothetical protein [Myxococcaceae bacterium]
MNARTRPLAALCWSALALSASTACGPTAGSPGGCSEVTCAGCCAEDGTCVAQTSATACGAAGAACVACQEGETCEAGACVAAQAQCPAPSSAAPSARSDFALAFDPVGRQLVVFGGDPGVAVSCMPDPKFEGETWFYDVDCGVWTRSAEPGPSARARLAGAFDTRRRRFLVFGGRYRAQSSGAYTNYNEVWALTFGANGSKAHAWDPLVTSGEPPPAMSSTVAVYDEADDQLIVFGGNASTSGLSYAPNANVWALSLSDNVWTELVPKGTKPPAREFHAAVIDPKRHALVVFGGGDANAFTGPFLSDTWSFSLDTHEWTKLATTGPVPRGRIRGALAVDPERDRVLLFGGHDDGQIGERNDLWSLDFASGTWTRLREGDVFNTAGAGFCDFPSDFVTPDPDSPERREAHGLVTVPGRGIFLFGGRSDCGNLNDVWLLDPETATWRNQKPTFSGLSCQRSGKSGCTTLCF